MKLSSYLKTRLRSGSFFASVALLSGGTALGQMVVAITAPILTRLFTPADFGTLAVYQAVVSILLMMVTLRYEVAILIPKHRNEAYSLLVLSFACLAVSTVIIGLGVAGWGDLLVSITNTTDLLPHLWLIPVGVFAAGVYQILYHWALREKDYLVITRTRLTQSVAMAVTHIICGLIGLGALGLLIGEVIGRAGGSLRLLSLKSLSIIVRLEPFHIQDLWKVAIRHRRFPMFAVPAGALNVAGTKVPALLLAWSYQPEIVGFFALTQLVIGLPSLVIGQAVSQVYMAEAATLMHSNPHQLRHLFLRTSKRLLYLSWLPATLLLVGGSWLFSVIFGASWLDAGIFLQIQAVMFLVQFIVTAVAQHFNILERQDLLFRWSSFRLVFVSASMLIAMTHGASPRLAIASYSASMSICYIYCFFLALRVLDEKISQTSRKSQKEEIDGTT